MNRYNTLISLLLSCIIISLTGCDDGSIHLISSDGDPDGDTEYPDHIDNDEDNAAEEDTDLLEKEEELPEETESDSIDREEYPEIEDEYEVQEAEETLPSLNIPVLQPVTLPDKNTALSHISSVKLADNSIISLYTAASTYWWAHSTTDRSQWETRPFIIPQSLKDTVKQQITPPLIAVENNQGGLDYQPYQPNQWTFDIKPGRYFRSWQDVDGWVHIPSWGVVTHADPPDTGQRCTPPNILLDLAVHPETLAMKASILHDFFTEDNFYRSGGYTCPNQIFNDSTAIYPSQIVFKPNNDGCNEAYWIWWVDAGYQGFEKASLMYSKSCDGIWEPWTSIYTIGDAPGIDDDAGTTIVNLLPFYTSENTVSDDFAVVLKAGMLPLASVGIHAEHGISQSHIIASLMTNPERFNPIIFAGYHFADGSKQLVTGRGVEESNNAIWLEVVFQSLMPDTWHPGPIYATHRIPPPYILETPKEPGVTQFSFEDHLAIVPDTRRLFMRYLSVEHGHEIWKSIEYNHAFNSAAANPHTVSILSGKQPPFFDPDMGISSYNRYFVNQDSDKIDIVAQRTLQPFNPYSDFDNPDGEEAFENLCFYRENAFGIREPAFCPMNEQHYTWDTVDAEWIGAGPGEYPVLVMDGRYVTTFDPTTPQNPLELYPHSKVGGDSARPALDNSSATVSIHNRVVSVTVNPEDRRLTAREFAPRDEDADELCEAISTYGNDALLRCKSRNDDDDTIGPYKFLHCTETLCQASGYFDLPRRNMYAACLPGLYPAGDQLRISCIQILSGISGMPVYTYASDDNGNTWTMIGEDLLVEGPHIRGAQIQWKPAADGQTVIGMAMVCGTDDDDPKGCYLKPFTVTPGQSAVFSAARHRVDLRMIYLQIDADANGSIAAMWRVKFEPDTGQLPPDAEPHPDHRVVHAVIYDQQPTVSARKEPLMHR